MRVAGFDLRAHGLRETIPVGIPSLPFTYRLILGSIITMAVAAVVSFTGTDATLTATAADATVVEAKVAEIPQDNKYQTLRDRKKVEELVRAYFADAPVMAEVARCESRYRHYDASGDLLRGEINSKDVGVMQINEYYHLETATNMGLDIHEFEDNLAYARYLFEREGTTPWLSSSKCWGVHNHIAKK